MSDDNIPANVHRRIDANARGLEAYGELFRTLQQRVMWLEGEELLIPFPTKTIAAGGEETFRTCGTRDHRPFGLVVPVERSGLLVIRNVQLGQVDPMMGSGFDERGIDAFAFAPDSKIDIRFVGGPLPGGCAMDIVVRNSTGKAFELAGAAVRCHIIRR